MKRREQIQSLEALIQSAASQYHRVVFVLGSSSDDRSDALAMLAASNQRPIINVGLTLSQLLLDIPSRHRVTSTPQVMRDMLGSPSSGEVVLLDHIEVLFTPDLAQDPVRLLQSLSRNETLVVSWPGTRDGSTLVYGEPGHPEYYKQVVTDLMHTEIARAEEATRSE